MKVILLIAIIGLALLLVSQPDKPNPQYQILYNGTNSYRESKDQPKLNYSTNLEKSAQERADYLCTTGKWSHDGWKEVVKKYTKYQKAAENLSKRYDQTEAVEAWINSPSHEKAMSGDYNKVGFGYSECNGEDYIVAHYAR